MRRWGRTVQVVVAIAIPMAACDSGEKSAGPPPVPPNTGAAKPAAPAATGAAAPRAVDPEKQELLTELRKRTFANDDFIESERNRDPFRTFLSDFSSTQVVTTKYKILLPKYSLEELKLVAIVAPPSGGERNAARAMFLDPSGTGITVAPGEHLSKADARLVRVDAERGRVILELKEDLGGNRTRLVERVLELHQSELAQEAKP